MSKPFWKSRTFWGTLIAAIGHVALAPDGATRTQAGVEGIGAVIAAIGVRDAIAKNGAGQ